MRHARAGFGVLPNALLDGDATTQLAHHECRELLNGHLLAVEIDLIVGVVQLGDNIVAFKRCQFRNRPPWR